MISIKFSLTGLEPCEGSTSYSLLIFLDSVLRAIGQVMLQNNSYAGLIFLIGIFYNSSLFGIATLIGSAVSTATAITLRADPSLIRTGIFGLNGTLSAVALLYFLHSNALTWGYVVLACACTTILMAALLQFLKVWKLPVLTSPFVFTTLCFLLACARFGELVTTSVLPSAGLPQTARVEGIVSLSTVIEGLFSGVAQVFFQGNAITGGIFIIGLLVSSRKACAVAIIGSLLGLLTAWGMGAAEPAIRSGAYGFNSVLTSLALGSVFFKMNISSWFYMVIAVVITTVVFAAISAALGPLGMPALTLPFVLVVWIFLLAGALFPSLLEKNRS